MSTLDENLLDNIKVERIEEFFIDQTLHTEISQLLLESFSTYPEGLSYYKQIPDFRYLGWFNKQLIAHLAVDHRLMSLNGDPIKVFGVADLCVTNDYQQRGIASHLLERLTKLGRECQLDFIVLMAKEHQLYLDNDFKLVENDCQWMMMNEYRSLGIVHRRINFSMMVKKLGDKSWEKGFVDFLGHIF
ncbi:MAG: GNAT family N-acetyltransferase [Bacteroidota bacterium]